MSTPSAPLPASPLARFAACMDNYFQEITSESTAPPLSTRFAALVSLVAIWAIWMYATWAHWGNLSVDCGREMYVAAELARGKILYKEVWFNFGPASPYINSFLFRCFGTRLEVLYWAGSISALGSAIFLYLAGARLSRRLVSWFASALLLVQSFHPSMFSFPLPYSFASAYGCLFSCIFLWLAVRALDSDNRLWILGAGMASAVSALLKPEYGLACYVSLGLLLVLRFLRSRKWKSSLLDLAAILPGLLLFASVVRWMISLAGFEFLTQENFQSWPTSFFMIHYGKLWLANTGFSTSPEDLSAALQRALSFLAIFQGLHLIGSWKQAGRLETILRVTLFFAAALSLAFTRNWNDALVAAFFPQDMGVFVSVAAIAALWFSLRRANSTRAAAFALLLIFSSILAFRIMMKVTAWGYPIFYNGPLILSFFFLARPIFSRSSNSSLFASRLQLFICLACLSLTLVNLPRSDFPGEVLDTLSTDRGTIVIPKTLAQRYRVAIQFMKDQQAQGQSVLSVPEDTSLYFLSGTHCPARVYAFTPGMVVPGKMTDELIRDIERQPVRYLIWSNRVFPEYHATRLGIDFDQTFGNYLFTHYHRVRPLLADPPRFWDWNAYIWERNSEDHR